MLGSAVAVVQRINSAIAALRVEQTERQPAPNDAKSLRDLLIRPAVLGFVATLAITLGAIQHDSPFTLKSVPGAWFLGIPRGPGPAGNGLLLGLVAFYGGMGLLFRVWYELVRLLIRRPGVPARALAVVFALWILPLLIAPPLFSRDVYSYAAQGEMVSHHINPYDYGTGDVGQGPYFSPVDPLWWRVPAPYGPLFLGSAGAIASLSGHHELGTVVGLRLLSLLGVALIGLFMPRLARSYGKDGSQAFALAVLNPLTLLHLVGGAHNDALMVGLLVSGIALARTGHPVVGIVACALAAAVKMPAFIGVVYVGWNWLGPVEWRHRIRPLVTAGIIAAAVFACLAAVTGLGWGWVFALGTPGTVRSLITPTTAVGVLGGSITHALGIGPSSTTLLSMARAIGLAMALVTGAWLLWISDRLTAVKALALTLLLIVILGPVIQPWYLAWGLILLAPVVSGRLRTFLIWLSMASCFIGLPGAWLLIDELSKASPVLVVGGLLLVLAIPAQPVVNWLRQVFAQWRGDRVILARH